ncbi:MAG TPA: putative quinol monooxygenase [Anaerolineaceae bacterium]|jgi:autoinducer 2-degrading protein|nr:putative quinol monooxygenase [Anaerolineaceae bacterium]
MLIVIVHVHVKEEYISAFCEASIENATNSSQEEGIFSFDVIQENDDPSKFALVEVYKDAAAAAAHKETDHYKKWKDTVAAMMAEARFGVKYHEIYPPEKSWRK